MMCKAVHFKQTKRLDGCEIHGSKAERRSEEGTKPVDIDEDLTKLMWLGLVKQDEVNWRPDAVPAIYLRPCVYKRRQARKTIDVLLPTFLITS